jgi:putative membrane protein
MRKTKSSLKNLLLAAIIPALVLLLCVTSCTKKENTDIVEIGEKMFIAQVNDIYLNADDYLGKKIKLEGVFKQSTGEEPYYFVIRYGPGCCGNDGLVGFEVAWDKEKAKPYPADDSWVEAEGVLKSYEEEGFQLSYIDLTSLNVLAKRGAETVTQ